MISKSIVLMLLVASANAQVRPQQTGSTFRFAVSGDSRNCGDLVMPAIAARATQDGAQFYWHLGDLRAIYDFDQDLLDRRTRAGQKTPLTISDYERGAWDDFIDSQLSGFGSIPVYVGIGNHETTSPKDRNQFLTQFADWLDTPILREQRLRDNPKDHRLKAYFHWIAGPVDFIYLDNATPDQFDREQLQWLKRVIAHDVSDAQVRSVVVGMHAALPDSLASGHSMNDWATGEQSGRMVYQDLLKFRQDTHKNVYILASHSHFYMANIFDSDYWHEHGGVLPGWIVGTAGAVRYALPPTANRAAAAMTNVYGYLLGIVASDGSVTFEFKQVTAKDVPVAVLNQYTPDGAKACLEGNSQAH